MSALRDKVMKMRRSEHVELNAIVCCECSEILTDRIIQVAPLLGPDKKLNGSLDSFLKDDKCCTKTIPPRMLDCKKSHFK